MATAPAPQQRYDRIASRFGIMFFDDPAAAFANMVRWLAPGGRFAFAVWGRPADNPWMSCVRNVTAEHLDLPPLDQQAPGPFRYGDAGTLLALLEAAGFCDVAVRDWRGLLPIGGKLSAPEAASFALAAFVTFGELLAAAGNATFDDAHRVLTARFAEHEKDGAVRMDACVHIITGANKE